MKTRILSVHNFAGTKEETSSGRQLVHSRVRLDLTKRANLQNLHIPHEHIQLELVAIHMAHLRSPFSQGRKAVLKFRRSVVWIKVGLGRWPESSNCGPTGCNQNTGEAANEKRKMADARTVIPHSAVIRNIGRLPYLAVCDIPLKVELARSTRTVCALPIITTRPTPIPTLSLSQSRQR